jgi:2-oxoisovalerate dehydrogenase E1 component beta subunit
VLTYLEAIRQAMLEEMDRDQRVFVIGEDVGTYGGAFRVTAGFLERYGETRVIDTPISESAIVGRLHRGRPHGHAPDRGDAVHRLHLLRLRPDRELRGRRAGIAGAAACPWSSAVPRAAACTAGPFHSQNPESYFMNVPG